MFPQQIHKAETVFHYLKDYSSNQPLYFEFFLNGELIKNQYEDDSAWRSIITELQSTIDKFGNKLGISIEFEENHEYDIDPWDDYTVIK